MKNNWILKVFLLTFILSIIFSTVSNVIANNLNVIFLTLILIIVIGIGIIFDMIGVAALTSKEATFHAKATRKINGAKDSVKIIKNSSRIASICCDVVGDICGIVSGSLVTILAIYFTLYIDNVSLITIVTTAIVSALTVGGKAIFKSIAVKKCDDIIEMVGKIIYYINIKKH